MGIGKLISEGINMKKKIALICAAFLAVTANSAMAAVEVETTSAADKYDTVTITTKDDGNTGWLTMYVYGEDGSLVFMDQQRNDEENVAEYVMNPSVVRYNTYKVVSTTDSGTEEYIFEYYTYEEKQAMIDEIISKGEVTDELAGNLSLDTGEESLYAQIKDKTAIISAMNAAGSVTPENLSEVFDAALLEAALESKDAATLKLLVEKYDDLTQLSANAEEELEWYNTDADADEFFARMAENDYADTAAFTDEFKAQAFLYKVKATSYTGLEVFLKNRKNKYAMDGNTFDTDLDVVLKTLGSQEKLDNVMYNVAGILYDDITALEKAISDKVTEENGGTGENSGNITGGTVSAGTGGSGTKNSKVSSTTYVPVVPAEVQNAIKFTDLDTVAWAKEAIQGLVSRGVVNGMSENTFGPDLLVTREQFAKMVVIAFGYPEGTAAPNFADVDSSAWYVPYVASCYENGIMIGTGDKFGIGEAVSRQDIAVVLARILEKKGISQAAYSQSNSFADEAEIAEYAKQSVNVLYNLGLMKGTGAGKVSPEKFASRAETAKLIYDMLVYLGK